MPGSDLSTHKFLRDYLRNHAEAEDTFLDCGVGSGLIANDIREELKDMAKITGLPEFTPVERV